MKLKADNGFGYVGILPMTIIKRDGLHVAETTGLSGARVGICTQGKYLDELVLYHPRAEARADYKGQKVIFVREEHVLSLVELDDDEILSPPFAVRPDFGKDLTLYG